MTKNDRTKLLLPHISELGRGPNTVFQFWQRDQGNFSRNELKIGKFSIILARRECFLIVRP